MNRPGRSSEDGRFRQHVLNPAGLADHVEAHRPEIDAASRPRGQCCSTSTQARRTAQATFSASANSPPGATKPPEADTHARGSAATHHAELFAVVARPHLGFRASKLGGNACTKLGAPQTPSVASCGSVRSLVESFCRYVDARQGRELCRSGHSPTLEDDHFELDT